VATAEIQVQIESDESIIGQFRIWKKLQRPLDY